MALFDLKPQVSPTIDEPVQDINEDFVEKVRATGANSQAWQAMRKRGKKELGKDYLLKALPILPSLPGKPVGRGRKAAMASKKKVLERPIMRPTPRKSQENPEQSSNITPKPPEVKKVNLAPPPETKDAQTSPMKVDKTKETEIEELEAIRDNEVLLMSTKMRGRDAKITEAQLKGDRTTLRELVKARDQELGRGAAKAVEAAKQKRKLETGQNDSKGVRRFTWFLDRRALDSKKEIWWSQNDDQGVAEIDLDGPKMERKRIKMGQPIPKDELERIEVAKEKINQNITRVKPTVVGQTLKAGPSTKTPNKGRTNRIVKLVDANQKEEGSESSEDVIEIDLTEEMGGITVDKPFKGKRRKIVQPKRQSKKQEDYEKWLDELRKEERKELKNVIIGEPHDSKNRAFDFNSGEIQKGPMFRSIPKWKYDDFKNQYRPLNKNFVNLITKNADTAGNLSYKERTQFKMGIY